MKSFTSTRFCFALTFALTIACSSKNSSPSGANCSDAGGPVMGATDTHCNGELVVVNPAACNSAPAEDDAGTGGAEFGDTMYNSEGDDDDCKFHVQWSATTLCENTDATISVILTKKSDGSAVPGATPWADIYLGAQTHPAPLTNQTYHETSPGHYTIGPVRFDAPGKWTMRFHFFPDACDVPESPHAHAAFYVNVP